MSFTKLIFDKSYVKCQDACYKSLVGIPTGGCNSRQVADILLHRLLGIVKDRIQLWEMIDHLRRFIDDIFGLWKGSKRQFQQFVGELNEATKPFGIKFGSYEIGSEVNFLDLTIWVDDEGLLQHKLYRKPTDSRLFLKTGSFHPPHVCNSVAQCQIARVARRNSLPEPKEEDLKSLFEDLAKCGHSIKKLEEHRKKVEERPTSCSQSEPDSDTMTMTLVMDYFHEISELKGVLRSLESDISRVTGKDTSVRVANRRGQTIGGRVVKNGSLCAEEDLIRDSQCCEAPKCRTCSLLCKPGENLSVNGMTVKVPDKYTCKSKNVLYIAQCKSCEPGTENTYVGQTTQAVHKRMNGHRSCFVDPSEKSAPEKAEKSALAEHTLRHHPGSHSMSNFKLTIYDQFKPSELDKGESILIEKLRTNVLGLNRMKVQGK